MNDAQKYRVDVVVCLSPQADHFVIANLHSTPGREFDNFFDADKAAKQLAAGLADSQPEQPVPDADLRGLIWRMAIAWPNREAIGDDIVKHDLAYAESHQVREWLRLHPDHADRVLAVV